MVLQTLNSSTREGQHVCQLIWLLVQIHYRGVAVISVLLLRVLLTWISFTLGDPCKVK